MKKGSLIFIIIFISQIIIQGHFIHLLGALVSDCTNYSNYSNVKIKSSDIDLNGTHLMVYNKGEQTCRLIDYVINSEYHTEEYMINDLFFTQYR